MQNEAEQQTFASEKFREQIVVIQTSWNRWLAALAALPDDMLQQPATCDRWSVKEVMAHVSAWEIVAVEKIEDIVTSYHRDSQESMQQFNDRIAAKSSQRSLHDVRRTMIQTHANLVSVLHAEVNRPFMMLERIESAIADDTYRHYDQHLVRVFSLDAVNG